MNNRTLAVQGYKAPRVSPLSTCIWKIRDRSRKEIHPSLPSTLVEGLECNSLSHRSDMTPEL